MAQLRACSGNCTKARQAGNHLWCPPCLLLFPDPHITVFQQFSDQIRKGCFSYLQTTPQRIIQVFVPCWITWRIIYSLHNFPPPQPLIFTWYPSGNYLHGSLFHILYSIKIILLLLLLFKASNTEIYPAVKQKVFTAQGFISF